MTTTADEHAPPPPGFSIAGKSIQNGNDRSGAESAPPRSFIPDSPFGISSKVDILSSVSHHHVRSSTGFLGLRTHSERTNSFSNLAAALGEGLAESIGDSLIERKEHFKLPR
jgi:hypothetical protein